tara:strand:+ start:372 stop:512 length:141 start_codon:yes stop_codon:yes gene_type:complete
MHDIFQGHLIAPLLFGYKTMKVRLVLISKLIAKNWIDQTIFYHETF